MLLVKFRNGRLIGSGYRMYDDINVFHSNLSYRLFSGKDINKLKKSNMPVDIFVGDIKLHYRNFTEFYNEFTFQELTCDQAAVIELMFNGSFGFWPF